MRSLRDLGVAALRRRWVNIVVTSMIKLYLFCCIQENIIARNRSKSLEEFPLDATLLCISRWAQQNAILIHLLVLVKLEVKLKCYIDSFQGGCPFSEQKFSIKMCSPSSHVPASQAQKLTQGHWQNKMLY
jgi:hypothetical protein